MMPAISHLNLEQIGLTISTVINVVAVVVATKSGREAQRLRKAQTSPEIGVYLDLDPDGAHWVDLVVRNVGGGSAFEVQLQLSDPTFGGRVIKGFELNATERFNYLPPGYTHRLSLAPAAHFLGKAKLEPVNADIRYIDTSGEPFHGVFVLDERPFRGVAKRIPPLVQIANELTRSRFLLEKLAASNPFDTPSLRVHLVKPLGPKRRSWRRLLQRCKRQGTNLELRR